MPKLRKQDVADINVDELEEAEYSGGSYAKYSGEIPPADTVLTAYVKSMWWTLTQNDDAMIKVLVIADENTGDEEEFNGLPIWENMALTTGAKFKWAPFFEQFGITVQDLKDKKGNSRVVVAAEDDPNMGAPIEKIGNFTPGSDESWCRVITSREKYNGNWQAHVAEWLDYEEPDEDADEEEPEEDLEDEETEDTEEEEDEQDDDVEEEETPPPARGRRTAAKASKAAPATPPRSTARKAAPARSGAAKATAAAPARGRGKRAASGSADEPPF